MSLPDKEDDERAARRNGRRGVLLHGFRTKAANTQLRLPPTLGNRRRCGRGQTRSGMKAGGHSAKFGCRSQRRSDCGAAPMWSLRTEEADERTEHRRRFSPQGG
jgi:hypothetical protein